jgi:hypothetical protein
MAVPLRSSYEARKYDGRYISSQILKGWWEVRATNDVYVKVNS